MATLLRPALRYSPTSVPSQEAAEGGGDAGLDYVANLLQSIVQATRVPVTSSHDQHTVHRGSDAQCDELHLVHLPIGGSSNPKIAEIQQLIDVLARRLWCAEDRHAVDMRSRPYIQTRNLPDPVSRLTAERADPVLRLSLIHI